MSRIIKLRNEQNRLPDFVKKYVNIKAKNFPTIRGISMAPKGWVVVEADLCTAEMRGLAFISGDRNLLKLLLEPDEHWAYVDPKFVPEGIDPGECVVPLSFPDYVTMPEDKNKYLMTYTEEGNIKAKFTEDQLLRDENGKIVSPKYDMHWGVVELSRHTTRLVLNKKKDRGAGKVVNFSSSYGGRAKSLARQVEQTTGSEPRVEDIEAMLIAIEEHRQQEATDWMHTLEQTPMIGGKLVAKSGRIRHCHTFAGVGDNLSSRTKDAIMTALGRECRNFFKFVWRSKTELIQGKPIGIAATIYC